MHSIDELYKQYGQLMIELEIIQAKINAVKQEIIKELNGKENSDNASE